VWGVVVDFQSLPGFAQQNSDARNGKSLTAIVTNELRTFVAPKRRVAMMSAADKQQP
jgi:hypothetical protein